MKHVLRRFILEDYEEDGALRTLVERAGTLAPNSSGIARVRLALLPLVLPELIAAVEKVIVDAHDKPDVRGFAGGLLSYVYNPLDIIPDDEPLGLVDDVAVCALGLVRLRDEKHVELDAYASALVDAAVESVEQLDVSLRDALERFVCDLATTTKGITTPLA